MEKPFKGSPDSSQEPRSRFPLLTGLDILIIVDQHPFIHFPSNNNFYHQRLWWSDILNQRSRIWAVVAFGKGYFTPKCGTSWCVSVIVGPQSGHWTPGRGTKKRRKKLLISSRLYFNQDCFLCQELDEYDSFYKKNIESVGYSSIYIQRSGQKRDGCGIFYKQDRWPSILSFFLDLYN